MTNGHVGDLRASLMPLIRRWARKKGTSAGADPDLWCVYLKLKPQLMAKARPRIKYTHHKSGSAPAEVPFFGPNDVLKALNSLLNRQHGRSS